MHIAMRIFQHFLSQNHLLFSPLSHSFLSGLIFSKYTEITVALHSARSWSAYNLISCIHHNTNHTLKTVQIRFEAAWLHSKWC